MTRLHNLSLATALLLAGPAYGQQKPLVIKNGQTQQIQPGDTLAVPNLSGLATISPLNTDAYGSGALSGKAANRISSNDSTTTTGLERYAFYAEQVGGGTGDYSVEGSTFAGGFSAIKQNWTNTTRKGQTIGLNIVTRGGYNGSDKTTPPTGWTYNPSGDQTGIIANGVQSSPYAQGAAFEGVQYYALDGAFTAGPNLKGMNVQLAPMQQKNADGSQANPGIGVAVKALTGSLNSAYTAYNSPAGSWGKFLSFGIDDVERFSVSASATDLLLGSVAPGDVVKFGPGNRIAYCPQLSCVPVTTGGVVHRAASALLSTTTAYDAQAEEDTLALYTVVDKGFARALNRSTAYTTGQAAYIGNAVYRATTSGTTASGSPPSGSRPSSFPYSVTDGGVTWLWINDYAVVAKTALYNEVVNKAGGGQSWAQANNYELAAGHTPTFNTNTEFDFANRSGTDCVAGVANCNALYIRMLGANYSTSAINVESSEAGVIFGARLTGPFSHAAVSIDGTSQRGIGLGSFSSGTYSVAAIDDASTSPTGLNVAGTKSIAATRLAGTAPTGLLLQGTFANQITGNGLNVDANGNSILQSLTVSGNFAVATPIVPPTATTACNKGQQSYDSSYFYVCVATDTWKRASLVSF